jgi:hypothetical protein
MIELVPLDHDDTSFLCLVGRIINGAVLSLQTRELYLVHVDNWFDWKWLGWRSQKGKELNVPPFDPNRICSEKHLVWNATRLEWTSVGLPKPLHSSRPGRSWLAQPLKVYSEHAAFIWYSGNTRANQTGNLMLYLSGAEDYAWYASFRKRGHWRFSVGRHTNEKEVMEFEHLGGQIEVQDCS